MAKQADFAYHLTNYLTVYLSGTKKASINTVWSYRDTFKLFLTYCDEILRISPEKLRIQMITPKMVSDFLKWLKDSRGNSTASVNQRLAAIHAFFKYLQRREPHFLFQCQQILAIEPAKVSKPMVGFLTERELFNVFDQIDESTATGRRDATLLRLLYDSAARVQELCDLRVRDVFLDSEPHVLLHGKGNKSRYVLIVKDVAQRISAYIAENHLNRPECMDMPLFVNQQRKKLTRAGVSYIVAKYADAARILSPSIPKKITPHIFRHPNVKSKTKIFYPLFLNNHSKIRAHRRVPSPRYSLLQKFFDKSDLSVCCLRIIAHTDGRFKLWALTYASNERRYPFRISPLACWGSPKPRTGRSASSRTRLTARLHASHDQQGENDVTAFGGIAAKRRKGRAPWTEWSDASCLGR